MMLTQKQILMSKLKARLRLTGFLILSYSTMLTMIQMSRLIQTSKRILMQRLTGFLILSYSTILTMIQRLKLSQRLRLIRM